MSASDTWKRAAANQKASWRKPKRSGFPSRLFQMFSDAISDWLPCNGCSCRLATAPENKTINQPLSVAVRGVTLEPLGVLCSARRRSKQLQSGLEDRKTWSAWDPRKPLCILECVHACTCMPSPACPCSSVSVISWGRCQAPWWMTSLTAAAVNSRMKGGTHPACAWKIGGTLSGSLTVKAFPIQSLVSMDCSSKTVHTRHGGQKVCVL